jgi:hypothetical protein
MSDDTNNQFENKNRKFAFVLPQKLSFKKKLIENYNPDLKIKSFIEEFIKEKEYTTVIDWKEKLAIIFNIIILLITLGFFIYCFASGYDTKFIDKNGKEIEQAKNLDFIFTITKGILGLFLGLFGMYKIYKRIRNAYKINVVNNITNLR